MVERDIKLDMNQSKVIERNLVFVMKFPNLGQANRFQRSETNIKVVLCLKIPPLYSG
jgi:hypothetical protein